VLERHSVASPVFLSLLIGFVGGCEPRPQPQPPPDPLDDLEERSGEQWRGVANADEPILTAVFAESPRALRARPALLAQAPRRASAFLIEHQAQFGPAMTEANLELRAVVPDPLGGARVQFALRVSGTRVDGGDAVVVLGPDGAVRSVSGAFPVVDELEGYPAVDARAAEDLALGEVAARWPDDIVEAEAPAELVALPEGPSLRPCWRVTVTAEGSDGAARREIYIDALGGRRVYEREGLKSLRASGSGLSVHGSRRALFIDATGDGTYQLLDATHGPHGIRTFTAAQTLSTRGAMVRSADPDGWDENVFGAGAAVDAHANAARVADYLRSSLGLDSWDGRGTTLRLVVHYGVGVANAFWDGKGAVFGDGDGDSFLPLSAGLDVVAHEVFHGVLQREPGLVYEAQSGALSESLSDVFGTLVEMYAGEGDWLMGSDVAEPAIRDLSRPWRLEDPSHMSEYRRLPVNPDHDMGGVHVNSTIPSYAAYLVAVGGTHPKSGISVMGIGVTKMGAIWWRAATLYLGPRAHFAEMAAATRAAAADLYGTNSEEVRAVEAAWQAVGVEQ
jgi:bacillolysin